PVFFVTARRNQADKILGLKLGADDYITKPFDIEEFNLRVLNRLNRNSKSEPLEELCTGRISIHLPTQRVFLRTENSSNLRALVDLTPIEYKILYYMIKRIEQPLSREEIHKEVW